MNDAPRQELAGTARTLIVAFLQLVECRFLDAEVQRDTTVLQALALVGGFSKFAATKRVQLRRADKSGVEKIYNVNYQDILAGKSNLGATVLRQGDVIIVPQRRLFE